MDNRKHEIDQKYRTMAIIWLILLLSQFMFLGVAIAVGGKAIAENSGDILEGEHQVIIFLFAFLAFANLALSFIMRKRAQEQAVAEQKPGYVQTGLILACAFCESISIMGFILAVAFGSRYFYIWFAVGIIGIFLHFPRRQHLLDASFN